MALKLQFCKGSLFLVELAILSIILPDKNNLTLSIKTSIFSVCTLRVLINYWSVSKTVVPIRYNNMGKQGPSLKMMKLPFNRPTLSICHCFHSTATWKHHENCSRFLSVQGGILTPATSQRLCYFTSHWQVTNRPWRCCSLAGKRQTWNKTVVRLGHETYPDTNRKSTTEESQLSHSFAQMYFCLRYQ